MSLVNIKELDGQIAVLTLNRPEKHNALNIEMMETLFGAIEELHNSSIRVVMIAAEGKTFCAGLDLREASDPALVEATANHVSKLLILVRQAPFVTIAAMQGDAFAGGAGLVAACDLAVMARGAKMGFPETKRGLVAALVSTLLVREVGGKGIRELLLTGREVDAVQCLSMGLVNHVVDGSKVMEVAGKLADKVLEGGTEAVKLTKKQILDLEGDFYKEMQHALALHHAVRKSEEAAERIGAFLGRKD